MPKESDDFGRKRPGTVFSRKRGRLPLLWLAALEFRSLLLRMLRERKGDGKKVKIWWRGTSTKDWLSLRGRKSRK